MITPPEIVLFIKRSGFYTVFRAAQSEFENNGNYGDTSTINFIYHGSETEGQTATMLNGGMPVS
jgi:hypothetical protein